MTPPASYARAQPAPVPQPCLAPPPVPVTPHHLSTAPLLPAPIEPRARTLRQSRLNPGSVPPPPHHDHRAPPPSYTCCTSPSASRPPRAAARVTPPSLSSRCGGPRALAGKNRAVCIPFSPNARKRPPSWQHPPEMHALRDQDGNILAPCIHFRAQSGDSGYMARESCRQGPFFASRSPKSRMARRCCQRRPAFLRQRPAVRPNGLCAMRRGPGLLAACAPPAISLVSAAACAPLPSRPRSSPPSYTRALRHPYRAHRAPPSAAPPIAVGMSCRSGSSCRPRAAHADASRHLRAAPIPPAARTHRVQETSGTTQTTQCGHKNRIPKWGPY